MDLVSAAQVYDESSSDFISATERVSDERRLVNSFNTSFGTATKTIQHDFLE